MKTSLLPRSRPGRWSAWLALAAILIVGLLYLGSNVLKFVPEWLASILGPAALISILAAPVLGMIAIGKKKERSWLVYLATAAGLAALAFMLTILITDLFYPASP